MTYDKLPILALITLVEALAAPMRRRHGGWHPELGSVVSVPMTPEEDENLRAAIANALEQMGQV